MPTFRTIAQMNSRTGDRTEFVPLYIGNQATQGGEAVFSTPTFAFDPNNNEFRFSRYVAGTGADLLNVWASANDPNIWIPNVARTERRFHDISAAVDGLEDGDYRVAFFQPAGAGLFRPLGNMIAKDCVIHTDSDLPGYTAIGLPGESKLPQIETVLQRFLSLSNPDLVNLRIIIQFRSNDGTLGGQIAPRLPSVVQTPIWVEAQAEAGDFAGLAVQSGSPLLEAASSRTVTLRANYHPLLDDHDTWITWGVDSQGSGVDWFIETISVSDDRRFIDLQLSSVVT